MPSWIGRWLAVSIGLTAVFAVVLGLGWALIVLCFAAAAWLPVRKHAQIPIALLGGHLLSTALGIPVFDDIAHAGLITVLTLCLNEMVGQSPTVNRAEHQIQLWAGALKRRVGRTTR